MGSKEVTLDIITSYVLELAENEKNLNKRDILFQAAGLLIAVSVMREY